MKINKQKHGKENTIGKIIYGFLMFMPLIAILTTCIYVIFNDNAYKSYTNENVLKYQVVNNDTFIKTGEDYFFDTQLFINDTTSNNNSGETYQYYYTNEINWKQHFSSLTDNENELITGFKLLRANADYIVIRFYDENEEQVKVFSISKNNFPIFTFISTLDYTKGNQTVWGDYQSMIIYQTPKLNEVFYLSIDKVEQSPLFNWAANTGTHDVLESTCQTLGITTPFIPMLLAYWLMMSLMYLLYDIALLVVHMAHNRIHDIESSI